VPDAGERHILSIFSTFSVGGPQVRFCRVVAALGAGYRHSVFAMDGNYGCAERLPASANVAFPPVAMRKGATMANVLGFARTLSAMRPDILLTHNWGTIEWAMANQLAGRRHLHIEDGFGPEERSAQIRRRVLTRRLFLRRATVVVPSRTLHDIATRIWRLPEQRLRYIPNGIDLDAYQREGSPPASGAVVIGTVAALRAEKNIARLIRAFATLPRQDAARLLVAGDGPERAGLEALATELGLTDRVSFLGHTTDVPSVLSRCALFALSSDTEQMPLSVLEAMAAGLPVAATDVGDVRAMLAGENAAFVVPPEEGALARALAGLAADPALRARIGAANRRKAEAEFDERRMFDAYRSLFDGVS